MSEAARTPYLVRSVVHACEVMRAFRSSGEALRLRDVVERTGLGKGLCFRLLHTLHHVGLVEKVDATRYRLTSEIGRRRRYRIGAQPTARTSS
jgi:DNA-binding IclR family transcriptional regulator